VEKPFNLWGLTNSRIFLSLPLPPEKRIIPFIGGYMATTESNKNSPGFFSFKFHIMFLPRLLLSHVEREDTGFSSILELYICFAVCLIFLAIGAPVALAKGSITGWIIGGIGAAGIFAMAINSIAQGMKTQPSYGGFLKGLFFFFLVLGISAGIFTGSLEHSFIKGALISLFGLITGYLLGILSGLWLQYLGWIADILNMLAFLAVIGMLLVDIVIIGESIF
jgi:hypothetical protein